MNLPSIAFGLTAGYIAYIERAPRTGAEGVSPVTTSVVDLSIGSSKDGPGRFGTPRWQLAPGVPIGIAGCRARPRNNFGVIRLLPAKTIFECRKRLEATGSSRMPGICGLRQISDA